MPKTKKTERAKYHLTLSSIPAYFLIVCLLTVFYFLYEILQPFLTVLLIAAILVTVFYPVFKKIRDKMPKHYKLASLITCLLVILVIVVPLAGFITLLTSEAVDTYAMIENKIEAGVFDEYIEKFNDGKILHEVKVFVEPVFDLESLNIKQNVIDLAQEASTFIVGQTATLVKNLTSIIVNFLIMLFSMYYFFKDGEMLLEKLMALSPLPKKYELALIRKFQEVSKATIFGIFLTAIAQGLVGGVGFLIAGIDHSIFWGTAMAFFSLIPLFGTAVIWVPASIILLIMGNYFSGIFLIIWGTIVVGSVDNFLRPYLIEGKAKLYPLLTFLTIFGGIAVFGLKGIIFGPLILALCMTFLHIYELEYKKIIKH